MNLVPNFVARWFERRSTSFMDILLANRHAGLETATGKKITALGSLQSTAVFACVRILAETVSTLPLILYERNGRAKSRAVNHHLFNILHALPNPEMTSVELRETLMGHLALWGNAYCEIQRDDGGRVIGLWPLRPDRVEVHRFNGELVYNVHLGQELDPNEPPETLPNRLVMHLKGLGYDGVLGYSPVGLARQAVGLALATEEFGATFFGNGARPGAVLEHPGQLSDQAHSRLLGSFEKRHKGLSNAHRMAILEEGMKLHEVGIPPEDAQFLETRKFQVAEIARMYRVPPHMLADLERATFSNIEHQSLEFVMHTMTPWLTRWEQGISRDLLTPAERPRYYAEHLVEALLRGDVKSRFEAYAVARQNGWMSANDIRERENMNPIEGGDVYLIPLNMVPADSVVGGPTPDPTPPPPSPEPDPDGDPANRAAQGRETRGRAENVSRSRRQLAQSYRRVILDATGRIIRREVNDVRAAIRKYLGKRSEQDFLLWLVEFYEGHRDFWLKQIYPVLLTYAEQVSANVADELGGEALAVEDIRQFVDSYTEALANRQSSEGLGQLRALVAAAVADDETESLDETLNERLDAWSENRAERITNYESHNALNAFAKAFYIQLGVTQIRSVASGDNCPYCDDLDGKVISIQGYFLEANQEFEPEGADRPLTVRYNVANPPYHDGCDCTIMAEVA